MKDTPEQIILLKQLNKLGELGASFSVSAPAPDGTQTFVCTPPDMLDLLQDQAAMHAACYGVSKEILIECIVQNFNIQCSGSTSKGKRCKNIVDDGHSVQPKEWAERQGEYCHLHSDKPADF